MFKGASCDAGGMPSTSTHILAPASPVSALRPLRRPLRRLGAVVVGAAAVAGLAACGTPPPDRLEIDPPGQIRASDPGVETTLRVNAYKGIKPYDDKKAPLQVSWKTSDGTVAVVSSAGVVKSTGSGSAQITASVPGAGGKEITASVDVKNVMVSTVEARGEFPKRFTLKSEPVKLTVIVKDEKGNVIDDPKLSFRTTDYCVEADNGEVRPLAVGECAIIVESAGKTAKIDVEVID